MLGGFELGTDGPILILVGIDGSETSLRAGAYAAGLARRQGSRLATLYVSTSHPLAASVPGAAAALVDTERQVVDELRAQVEQGAAQLGVPVTFLVATGDPYNELVRLAEELRADAVVVGASMKAGHRYAGSLAVRLVRAGRWPVTVVP